MQREEGWGAQYDRAFQGCSGADSGSVTQPMTTLQDRAKSKECDSNSSSSSSSSIRRVGKRKLWWGPSLRRAMSGPGIIIKWGHPVGIIRNEIRNEKGIIWLKSPNVDDGARGGGMNLPLSLPAPQKCKDCRKPKAVPACLPAGS